MTREGPFVAYEIHIQQSCFVIDAHNAGVLDEELARDVDGYCHHKVLQDNVAWNMGDCMDTQPVHIELFDEAAFGSASVMSSA